MSGMIEHTRRSIMGDRWHCGRCELLDAGNADGNGVSAAGI